MALWLFRRKTLRSSAGQLAAESITTNSPSRSRSTRPGRAAASRNDHHSRASSPAPRASARKSLRAEPNKLRRRPRNYSFSPNRRENLPVSANGRSQPTFHCAEDDAWIRSPTLYLKRDSQPFTRRKSSKRRHDDHEREAEIKAMSANVHHIATHRSASGIPNIKRSKINQPASHVSKRTSDPSLSLPDSMNSSTSGDSDPTSYKVSTFDSLSPRPTLRYTTGTKRILSRVSTAPRPVSPDRLLSENNAILEELSHSRQRIDNLADGMDAKALHELMDRDSKRRQRALVHEQSKTRKKIAQRAERHTSEAEAAKKSGFPSPANMERGVLGRELVGLGLDPASTTVTSSRQRAPLSSETCEKTETSAPLQVFHGADAMQSEDHEAGDDGASSRHPGAQCAESEEHASTEPQVPRFAGARKPKKAVSKSTLESDKEKLGVLDDEYDGRKGSDTSAYKSSRLSLSSLLKWNSRGGKRGSGPSSFSNTSREEMQAVASAQAQAEALARLQGDDTGHRPYENLRSGSSLSSNHVASKLGTASMVKRTRSRFREDLDDFPTPPDSRVQSPDAEPTMANAADAEDTATRAQAAVNSRSATPITFGQRSVEKLRESSMTEGSYNAHSPSPDPPLSMSLASIDSEGSWLSGGVGHRRSGPLRDGHLRVSRPVQSSSSLVQNPDEELELGITEDEYMARLAPSNQSNSLKARRSEEGRPSSDEDEGDLKWGAVGAHPHIVHRINRSTIRSQQALLNIDSGDEESATAPPT